MKEKKTFDIYSRIIQNIRKAVVPVVTSATIVAFSTASALAQVVFRTTQVTGFTVVQGVVSSPRNVVERLQGALWQFNPDGTLIFAPANSRTDLYPLTVNYQAQGNTVFFSGGRSINIGGTGLALAEIVGNVDFSSSTPIMTLRWISGTSNSFVGIGGPISSGDTNVYDAQLILSR